MDLAPTLSTPEALVLAREPSVRACTTVALARAGPESSLARRAERARTEAGIKSARRAGRAPAAPDTSCSEPSGNVSSRRRTW